MSKKVNKKLEVKKMSIDMKPGDYCEVFNKKLESKGFYFFYSSQNGMNYYVKEARKAVSATSPLFGSVNSKQVFKYAKVIKRLELNIEKTKAYVKINGIIYSQFNELGENRELSALILYFNSFEYEKFIL